MIHDTTLYPFRRIEGAERAVVFVHGFSGDLNDTWDRFPGLLGSYLDWDIFLTGYATSLVPDASGLWRGDPEIPVLATLAGTRWGRSPLDEYQSLALVGHSMGGLVIQRALLDQKGLADRTSHVALYGTPSRGVKAAAYMTLVKRQLKNMAPDSEFISALRADWDERFGDPPFELVTVAGKNDLNVGSWSSLEPFARRSWRTVEGGHKEIVKPSTPDVATFRVLLAAFRGEAPPPETVEPLTVAAETGRDDVGAVVADYENRWNTLEEVDETEIVEVALALERAGQRDVAIELLERNPDLGTDSQGTLAGRIKRIWLDTEEPAQAKRSYEIYSAALGRSRNDLAEAQSKRDWDAEQKALGQISYLAINVAFLEFVFHDRPDRAREQARFADEHARRAGPDVWNTATQAEAQLYLGEPDAAVELYERMIIEFGEEERW